MSSVLGFENVTGQELAMAKCFAGGANGFNSLLSTFGLAPFPIGPFCVAFPQETVCGTGAPNDACANNPAGIPMQHVAP